MAAAATFSFGVLSTICSFFGADVESRGNLDYLSPTAVRSQLAAASVSIPAEVGPVAEVRSFDLGGVRIISIDHIDELQCHLDAATTPELGTDIATTVLEGSLEAGLLPDERPNSMVRQRFLCRMAAIDTRSEKMMSVERSALHDAAIAVRGINLSLPGHAPVKSRIRVGDAALLGITLDQIRRRLDTHTVEIVTGSRIPDPRAGMMILEGM